MAWRDFVSDEVLNQVKELHSKKLSNRAIAKELGCHHNTVSYWFKKLGLQSNTHRQPIDMVSDEEARCSKCKEIKNIIEFHHGRRGQKYEYSFSYCISCRERQVYASLNNNVNAFLKDRWRRIKDRCKKNDIEFIITQEEFITQYNKQQGKCFYTDEIMLCQVDKGGVNKYSLSADRIYFDQGYTKENTILCCFRINAIKRDLTLDEMKKWMPDWYQRIIDYQNHIE